MRPDSWCPDAGTPREPTYRGDVRLSLASGDGTVDRGWGECPVATVATRTTRLRVSRGNWLSRTHYRRGSPRATHTRPTYSTRHSRLWSWCSRCRVAGPRGIGSDRRESSTV